ncbi:MAG: hypothetical protein J0I10_03905 [Verrucomicrobia bacterium]|nr:hypothetical protein [Verrucomicrobiota bacterium]
MKSLYMVFSPFQMLNAIEARHSLQSKNDECHLVYCRAISDRNAEQIRAMIEETDWASVFYDDSPEERSLYRKRFSGVMGYASKLGPFDRMVVGHFGWDLGRHVSHALQPREVVVLDDGTAGHRIYNYRFSDVIPSGGQKRASRVASLFSRYVKRIGWGMRTNPYRSVTFFSIYQHRIHACDQVIPNRFDYLRSQVKGEVEPGLVAFLGGCQVELGILSADYYRHALEVIRRHYPVGKLLYFPHRRESTEKLESLAKQLDFAVVQIDVPFEMHLIGSDILPEEIVTLYSTAIDSCGALLEGKDVRLTAFELDPDRINGDEQRHFIQSVYAYYRAHGRENTSVLPIA